MADNEYTIVVPSYKRASTLKDKTLDTLQRHGAPPERIVVFVANEEERQAYESGLTPGTFGKLVVGVPGMMAIRNFIQEYFDEGERLFCIDDDIAELNQKVDDKKFVPIEDLNAFIEDGFRRCVAEGLYLFGIYPVLNPLFMSNNVTKDLRYIIGCTWGCINRHGEEYSVTLDDKEDVERTIKYYIADDGVLRFNGIAPKTNYYKQPGGMQETRTEERITESAKTLVERYPMLCTLNLTKKSGHAEVRLKDRRSKHASFF